MPDESNELPTSRIVRWLAIAALIGFAIAMYFRAGTSLPPATATGSGAAADSGN